jgi:hypothetical protein
VLFGVGYGVASFACTLPVFLSLLGAASSSSRFTTTLVVFGAYALGLAIVLMVLAIGAALARDGLSRWVGRMVPYVGRLTGVLLVVSGAYLVYFWLRAGLGAPADAASDPLIAAVTDFAAWIEVQAHSGTGAPLVLAFAALIVLAAMIGFGRPGRTVVGALVLLIVGGLAGYQVAATGSNASDSANPPDSAMNDWLNMPARAATDAERQSLRNEGRASDLSDLSDLGRLRAMFDEDAGRTRIIALLSPTCVTCLRGADWLQQQLAEHPDADVQVYAVWLPLLPTDERTQWDDRILTDSRVTHLWDQQQSTGRWFAERGHGDLPVQWDAVLLYGPDAEWGEQQEPSNLIIWRRPIIAHADELSAELEPFP